jgi:hypothetical protein
MPAHPVAVPEEARAEHVVGAPAGDRVQHTLEVRRGVLAVAVEVDRGGVALVPSELEPRAERRAEAARGVVRDDPRGRPAGDRGRGVAGAVVHEEPVDGHPAGFSRDAREHVADGRLLVACDDDGEAAPGARRLHRRVESRHQRAAARRGRGLDTEKLRDRGCQLAHRAWLAPDRAWHRPGAPDDERHRPLAPVEVAVTADSASLPVVGHQDHGRVLELAALVEEGDEVAHVAVGLSEPVEVLRAANAADVAELVGGEQLQDEQVGILLLDHPPALRAQRAVDLRGGLNRGDRANHLLAERVEQVGDPHQAAAAAVSRQNVEDRLHPHP